MTDPSIALQSFQEVLLTGTIELEAGRLDTNLYSYVDVTDSGTTRFTLVRLEGKTVTAFVEFAQNGTIKGKPCFAIGYAVPEVYRHQGRAKEIVGAAIAEVQAAFRKVHPVFYVEAVVGLENKYSQRIAAQLICNMPNMPEEITDKLSGLPALRYVLKVK